MSSARAGIENTLYRYAWAYDMNLLDELDEVFTQDAECEYMDVGLKSGHREVVAEQKARHGKYADGTIPWHVISNIYITDETDTTATVRSWWTFFVQAADGSQRFAGAGWYDDRFKLEDGVWRIWKRRILKPNER